jgi:hypothetical protein
MYGIFLPKQNLGFIFTHKSGSRLLLNTLKTFCEIMKYGYFFMNYENAEDHLIMNKKAKFYVFTRNPIDRFLSGYNWVNKILIGNKSEEFNEYYNDKNLKSLESYIKNYSDLCDKFPDPHYNPQTFGILNKDFNNDFFNGDFNFRKEFDKKFYSYKIINIEDIDNRINKDIELSSLILDEKTEIYRYQYQTIDIFEDFYELGPLERCHFNFTYSYIKNMLNIRHHLNVKQNITNENFDRINKLFINEVLFFGYNIKNLQIAPPDIINLSKVII